MKRWTDLFVIFQLILLLPTHGEIVAGKNIVFPIIPKLLSGVTAPASPVVFADGHYAIADASGKVFFSMDAKTWKSVELKKDQGLKFIRHDGEQWVAATTDGLISISPDRETWSPFFESEAALERAVQWRGDYWVPTQETLEEISLRSLKGSYRRGSYRGGKDAELRDWDGRLLRPYLPGAFWIQGGRLHVIRKDRQNFVTENGDYYATTPGIDFDDPAKIFAAEGNGRIVTFAEPKNDSPAVVAVQIGAQLPKTMKSDFFRVAALAYGGGRFMILAKVIPEDRFLMYESSDGMKWMLGGSYGYNYDSLAYGSAGFVFANEKGEISIENPRTLQAQPPIPHKAVPIPPLTFYDFGEGETGKLVSSEVSQAMVRSLQLTLESANEGDLEARVDLAHSLVQGKFTLSNPWRAELWFKEGMAANIPSAARGYAELLEDWKPRTEAAEFENLYLQSAERGDARAVRWMALNLKGEPQDPGKGIEYWRKLALKDDPKFSEKIAKLDQLKGYLAKAKEGDLEAIAGAVPILVDGDLSAPKWDEAITLATTAAKLKKFEAAFYLLRSYHEEFSTSTNRSVFDFENYHNLLRICADGGERAAQALLIQNVFGGAFGFKKDQAKAIEITKGYAASGEPDFIFAVAQLLHGSEPPNQDKKAAKEWAQKAADLGHEQAKAWVKEQEGK